MGLAHFLYEPRILFRRNVIDEHTYIHILAYSVHCQLVSPHAINTDLLCVCLQSLEIFDAHLMEPRKRINLCIGCSLESVKVLLGQAVCKHHLQVLHTPCPCNISCHNAVVKAVPISTNIFEVHLKPISIWHVKGVT